MAAWFSANEVLLQTMLVYAVLAYSVQISLRAGVFSLASIGCWGIGAYAYAILTLRGVNVVAAVGAGILLAGVVSYLLAMLLVRLRGLYLGMATIAFNQMVAIAIVNGGDWTGGEMGLFGIGLGIGTVPLLVIVAVISLLLLLLERGNLARAYDVVRDDEDLGISLGIDTKRLRRFAFTLSGVVGALGGALNAMLLGIVSPSDVEFQNVVLGLTMVIVGGFHSWRGALIGALVIVWLPVGLQTMGIEGINEWWTIVYGGLIFVIAVFAPQGILGALEYLATSLAQGRKAPADRLPRRSGVADASGAK